MAPRLIPPEALKFKGIHYSRVQLWRLEKAGKFPRRVLIGTGKLAYVEAEVDAFIEAKIAARDAKHSGRPAP